MSESSETVCLRKDVMVSYHWRVSLLAAKCVCKFVFVLVCGTAVSSLVNNSGVLNDVDVVFSSFAAVDLNCNGSRSFLARIDDKLTHHIACNVYMKM